MIIKILGPVGSGKSTISKKLAEKLGMTYIPEFEENDLTFHRLLMERNTSNTAKSKKDFQNYTFEQAYKRQIGLKNAVIDTPIYQHILMAEQSLSSKQYIEYLKRYFDKIHESKYDNEIIFILNLPFDSTIERIKERGRVEETLSKEELYFYESFYNSLYSNWIPYLKESILIDASKDPDSIIEEMLKTILSSDKIVENIKDNMVTIKEALDDIKYKIANALRYNPEDKMGVIIDVFYRADRGYWYKLIDTGKNLYYITYDFEYAEINDKVDIKDYNKIYAYNNIQQVQEVFDAWKKKYKQ